MMIAVMASVVVRPTKDEYGSFVMSKCDMKFVISCVGVMLNVILSASDISLLMLTRFVLNILCVTRNCLNLTLANSSCLCVLTFLTLYNLTVCNGLISKGQQSLGVVIGSIRSSSVSSVGSVDH